MAKKNLKNLEIKLGVRFQDQDLLSQALIHRSFLNEAGGRGLPSNERLEFLGDAILSFVISAWLYEKYPKYPEGKLTNFRANAVRTTTLAKIALKLNLGDYLCLSHGEKASGGQKNPSLLADTMEAVIGALYLDQGLESVRKFIFAKFGPVIKKINQAGDFKDAKSLLQEKLQAETGQTPFYQTIGEKGPDHDKIFTVGVYLEKKLLAKGQGKNKQEAEAKAALKALKKEYKWLN